MKIKELGHIVLYVTRLETVADFYKITLGFKEIVRRWPLALFSAGRTHHEMLLIEVGGVANHSANPRPGLYHIGFKIGDSTQELRAAYRELKKQGVRIIGSTDHGITHSLYIADPDGNEIELYVDVSSNWKDNPEAILVEGKFLDLE